MSELMRLYNTYLCSASDTLLDIGSPNLRWKELFLNGSISSANVIVGSSIILSNSAKACINSKILTSNAVSLTNGDTWFQSSSNIMYLFVRSGAFNYYVSMNT